MAPWPGQAQAFAQRVLVGQSNAASVSLITTISWPTFYDLSRRLTPAQEGRFHRLEIIRAHYIESRR